MVAITLQSANMIGYIKCKKDAGKEMKSMATSFLGRQIIGQVSAFRKSSERKPIKIQQHVYNDWSAMFKNNTKTYCGVFFSIYNYSRVCFRVLIVGFYFYHEFASVFQ